jgi:predicted TIM-barrel fold metal-dependent hydrolase
MRDRCVMEAKTDVAHAVEEILLVDTHEHIGAPVVNVHFPCDRTPVPAEREWVEGSWDILRDLFGNYVQDDLVVAGAPPSAVERLIDPSAGDIESRFAGVRDAWAAVRHTGYGEAVRLLASEVYGLDDITLECLEQAQSDLEQLRRPGEMLRMLRETARLDHVQIDNGTWVCEADASGADFFLHDLSWWNFCRGEIEAEALHRQTGIEVRTLQDLQEAMADLFRRFAPHAIAVKAQHAYSRTLRWEERSDDEAARALRVVLSGEADEQVKLVLGDWCWARGVELAIEHNLPFKLHTGAYGGHSRMPVDRIRAGNLCGLLARYPEARFVLMHIAYPYTDELVAVAKHYPNVWVDMCWAWSVDPYSSLDFVRRFLHAVPTNKLFAFGGDTRSPTTAVAYSIQARRWLTRALEADVTVGDLTEQQAIRVAQRLMRENQYMCFDIEGTRAAARAESEHGAVSS